MILQPIDSNLVSPTDTNLDANVALPCATAVKEGDYNGDAEAAHSGDTITYTCNIYNSGTTTISRLTLLHSKVCWTSSLSHWRFAT